MYDIFYIGTNTELKEKFPFSKQIDDVIDAVASEFEMPPMGVSMEGDSSMDVERRRTKEFRF